LHDHAGWTEFDDISYGFDRDNKLLIGLARNISLQFRKSSENGHFHIDHFVWTARPAFNAHVSANDSTTIDADEEVESTHVANRRITVVRLDLDDVGGEKVPDKLVLFEAPTASPLKLKCMSSWEQVAGRFCLSSEMRECPPD
jgi:hypothetical protein